MGCHNTHELTPEEIAVLLILLDIADIPSGEGIGPGLAIIFGRKISKEGLKKLVRQKIKNALKNYRSIKFTVGNKKLLLDKKGMSHILERHHPNFWNGESKAMQSFFSKKMSTSDIQHLVREVIKQNRNKLQKLGANSMGSVRGVVNGVEYQLGINKGRIGQFFPIK